MSVLEASNVIKQNYLQTFTDGIFKHLIWGVTLGVVSTLLTRKFGTHYRCHICDIEFSKIKTYEHHRRYVHESPSPSLKHILILGGGFGGVEVLKKVQDIFEDDVNINISLVSEDNFFLFTPMLPEVSSGMIESRHITTPVRTFCRRAKFYEAKVDSVDLKNKSVIISRLFDMKKRELKYDYLVLALGSKTNYFGNKNLEKYALTIKTLADAMTIRNHVIAMLESADQEDDVTLKEKLLTFVVVGGGFSGVETVGEINDFIRESAENFYRSIDPKKIRIILVSSGPRILPEVGEELGDYAANFLNKAGIEILTSTKVVDVGKDFVLLDNKTNMPCNTLIWAGGVAIDPVVSNLDCEHDKIGRVTVDEYLRVKNHPNVFALGDCASIIDTVSGKPYPPTAQHAIREAKIVFENLVSSIKGTKTKNVFSYKSKGTMATIGKRTGVAILMGHKVSGLLAWFIWRQYYLTHLPSSQKKIRVAVDWILDLFSKRDVTRLRNLKEKINDDVLQTVLPDIEKLS
ncbi:MAG: NAD(P)/FAD-dependent oxidoreductase [Thaumarchaeota archaeon]|nr:NAD(P)/FAD-dependent oxidoreductase [Nitrososphaerota archaeon]